MVNVSDLIINLHRRETANIGDLRSAPLLYDDFFPEQRCMEVTGWKREDKASRDSWLEIFHSAKGVIYGGGGLLEFPKYEDSLNFIAENKKKCVIWGAGHNAMQTSWSHIKPKFAFDYSGYKLKGVRDFGYEAEGFEWVPCASAMSKMFDLQYETKREYVFFGNAGMKGYERYLPSDFPEDAIMLNMKTNIKAVISFLGSAETVLTSSFHGAYWAMLLGKKVVGIPTSSKFYGFKHPVPLCHASDWQRYAKLARTYPEALEECREANRNFAEKVKDYFLS